MKVTSRTIVFLLADLLLAGLLVMEWLTHFSLIFWHRDQGVGVAMPRYQLVLIILALMGAVTAWWLLGPKKRSEG